MARRADEDPVDRILDDENITAVLTSKYEFQFSAGCHFDLSGESAIKAPDFLSVIIFPPLSDPTKGSGRMFKIPLIDTLQRQVDIKLQPIPFHMKTTMTIDSSCIGMSGQRAVWLQRRWDTDEFEFIRASFSSSAAETKIVNLLPKHLALPFEAHRCSSLAFDEASGRVCIGLHTGEIFVLDL